MRILNRCQFSKESKLNFVYCRTVDLRDTIKVVVTKDVSVALKAHLIQGKLYVSFFKLLYKHIW